MMPVLRFLSPDYPVLFNDTLYYHVVEDQLPLIRQREDTRYQTLTPMERHRFEFDFYNLLVHLNIEHARHWLTLRLNGMYNPSEFREHMEGIWIPSANALDSARQHYQSYQKNR